MNIFVCGPDGTAKTALARKMSSDLSLPYFKVETEKQNWAEGTFKQSLKFDALLPSFCRQTGTSFVGDRGYACEFAYAKAFGRDTDLDLLRRIDDEWAEMGATTVLCFLKDYSKARPDELVKQEQLKSIEDAYIEFADWTMTDVVGVYVDEFEHAKLGTRQQMPIALTGDMRDPPVETINLDAVCREVYAGLEAYKLKKKYPRVYEIIRAGEVER